MILRAILIHGVSTDRPRNWYLPLARAIKRANPGYECFFYPVNWERIRERDRRLDGIDDITSDLSAVFDPAVTLHIFGLVTSVVKDHAQNDNLILLVGHSYGSILAYMAAHALYESDPARTSRIDKMVTLGSPIWMAERGPLRRMFRNPRKPRTVRKWTNVLGLLDPVTLFGLGFIKAADENRLAVSRHDLNDYVRSAVTTASLIVTPGSGRSAT